MLEVNYGEFKISEADSSKMESSKPEPIQVESREVKYRWLILFLYSFSLWVASVLTLTLAPVTSTISDVTLTIDILGRYDLCRVLQRYIFFKLPVLYCPRLLLRG
jgi:hypothetical protein